MGEVIGVNVAPLLECIEKGITPVISPTARGEDGKIYNCNADVAAAQAAIALKARRLVFMSDVPGLLQNPEQAGQRHLPPQDQRGGRPETGRGDRQGDDSQGR